MNTITVILFLLGIFIGGLFGIAYLKLKNVGTIQVITSDDEPSLIIELNDSKSLDRIAENKYVTMKVNVTHK